jgi:hypothetical protein
MARFFIALLSLALTATFFAFSLVIFLVLLAVAVPLMAFFWWRLRQRVVTMPSQSEVIEAQYVVLEEPVEKQRQP